MSQENVEAMRAAMEAFNRRDGEGFGALLARDAEIVPVRAALEGTVYRGPDAAAKYCAAVDESWADLRWEVEEIRDGGSWVLALGHIRGGGRESGAVIDARAGWVAHFHDGFVTTFQTYADREKALEAVGLSRDTAPAMSQKNAELARLCYDAIHRRDLDGLLALMDDDVEAVSRQAPMEGGFHGHDGIRRMWEQVFEVFPDLTVQVVELRDVGDAVVGGVRFRAHGAGSDIPMDWTVWQVGRFRQGKCLSLHSFETKAQALEAVALSE
jgi:ketosteroid isomerase-like protein